MPRLRKGEAGKYLTPYGKKVIAINVTPEYEAKILAAASKKNLTRQSYIVTAINEALERDERKEQANEEQAGKDY